MYILLLKDSDSAYPCNLPTANAPDNFAPPMAPMWARLAGCQSLCQAAQAAELLGIDSLVTPPQGRPPHYDVTDGPPRTSRVL